MTADRARIIAPPPLALLAAILAGWGLQYLWPLELPASFPLDIFGWVLIAAGGGLDLWAVSLFWRAKTAINPYQSTTTIVARGPYRFTRNPMYLGFLLLLAGIGLIQLNAWMLVMTVPLVLFLRYGVIAREERYLEDKFGDGYRRYKASVRRWL